MNKFLLELFEIVKKEFSDQASLISGIIIGMIIISLYNRFFGERKLINSYEVVIKSKDEHIKSLNKVIHERLGDIDVEKKDKAFFKRLKQLFI